MHLKPKVTLILAFIFSLFLVLYIVIQESVIFPGFTKLENEQAIQNMDRVKQALDSEIQHLDTLCHDWSGWDDTYDFIHDRNAEYIMGNLNYTAFANNGNNLMFFYNNQNELVWGKIYDLKTNGEIKIKEFATTSLPAIHPFFKHQNQTKSLGKRTVSGVFITTNGPLIISSRPILTSKNTGPPRGTLVMGKFLNQDYLSNLNQRTKVDFIVLDKGEREIEELITKQRSESKYWFKEINKEYLNVISPIFDINGQIAFYLKTKSNRKITLNGRNTLNYALVFLLISGIIFLCTAQISLNQILLNPLSFLQQHILMIQQKGDFSLRLNMDREDEIGLLASEFDDMIVMVENQQQDLEKSQSSS